MYDKDKRRVVIAALEKDKKCEAVTDEEIAAVLSAVSPCIDRLHELNTGEYNFAVGALLCIQDRFEGYRDGRARDKKAGKI